MKKNWPNEKIPKVTVCVVTYNQEKYIKKCLESILSQKVDFVFDVIVGDDCSSDKTQEIIRYFSEKYPKIIKPIFNSKNVGMCKNLLNVHLAATGEYVSHCDGDDYFLAGKLQAQSDALDSNKLASMAIHKMLYVGGGEDATIGEYPVSAPLIFDLNYLVRRLNFIPHSSKMYRRSGSAIWPAEEEFIDFQLHINDLARGSCIYIPTTYGVYRCGLGVSADLKKKKLIEQLMIQALGAANRIGASKLSIAIALFKIYFLKSLKTIKKMIV